MSIESYSSRQEAEAQLADIKQAMGGHYNAESVLLDALQAGKELMVERHGHPSGVTFTLPATAIVFDSPLSYASSKGLNGLAGRKPIPLTEGYRANMKTMLQAAAHDDLACISAVRKSDGADVALVVAMGWDAEMEEYLPSPLAVMLEGDPFQQFYDPTSDCLPDIGNMKLEVERPDPWENNAIQFSRMLAEIHAVGLTEDQIGELCSSMDLDPEDIEELLERAEEDFEGMKPAS